MPELSIQAIVRLLIEAAQRLRESRRPDDIADVLPVLERAAEAVAELYQPSPIVLTYYERSRANAPLFRMLPPQSRRQACQVFAYMVGDPCDTSGRPPRPFYFFARWKGGKGECLMSKASMEELAVLLGRWARFMADADSVQHSEDSSQRPCDRKPRYDLPNDQEHFHSQSLPAAPEPRTVPLLSSNLLPGTQEISQTSNGGGGEPPEATSGTKAVRDKKLESRDEWIYQQCFEGSPYKEIRRQLNLLCPKEGWRKIESIQGIRAAAAKHAQRHNKPAPPKRQNL